MTGEEFTKLVNDFCDKHDGMTLYEFISERYCDNIEDMSCIRDGNRPYKGSDEDREWILKYKDQYFKVSGYYASYEGYHIEDKTFREVKPYKITITEYK